MKLITAAIAAAALSCAFAAQAAIKSTKVDPPIVILVRGSTPISPAPLDMVECEARKAALTALDGTLKTTGSGVYDCLYRQRTRIAFGPNPPPAPTCTTPKPAQESQTAQCPAPTVGTWPQTREYVAAAYPTCWTAGEWTPTSAPAGICATATTLVFACPEAGADGRILESSTVVWPNCPTAGLKVPSKSLVVAVNTGSQPSYWRLASKLTDEKIWTQTGTVGAWTKASAIDWGTAAPPAGTVTLSWTPPTERVDGTALTNLAGYRVVYGTSATELSRVIEVPNPAVTSYVVEQLSPATWFFAVKAFTTTGKESDPSNIASKTLP